jgi:indole-3-pyruvate monooxygenase
MILGDLSKLGFRRPSHGPIAQIKTTSRIPLIDIGTIRLVREGHIDIRGGISSIGDTAVTFEDGSSRAFDAIVLATGFRSGLERFLQARNTVPYAGARQRTERAIGPAGLYFCGFLVSATGMLRDIGIEAHRIAEHITGVHRPVT